MTPHHLSGAGYGGKASVGAAFRPRFSRAEARPYSVCRKPIGGGGMRPPCANAPKPVIPARTPESRHKDVNPPGGALFQSNACATGEQPSMALDSGVLAGMTGMREAGE
jgi:hypothetical protein